MEKRATLRLQKTMQKATISKEWGKVMPIRHTVNGWYWGSKGPFANKAKALQVARAAHASGFKEEQTEMNNEMPAFTLTLLHAITNTHILHLRANSTATHLALGEFYPQLEELVDSLVESYQGKYGKIEQYGTTYDAPVESPVEYMIGLLEYVVKTRVDIPKDTYIQNIVDEVEQTIAGTLNKLRFYK